MERERHMAGESGSEAETSISSLTPQEAQQKLNLSFLPREEEMPIFDEVVRRREQEERLEEIQYKALKEREKNKPPSDILRKQKEGQMAERFGLPAEPEKGWKYEWIHSQQLGEIPVPWPETQDAAEKHIKSLLGRIEIAQTSATQQMQVDLQYAQSVLEVLEVREKDEKGNPLDPTMKKDQQKWAAKMRLEMKARLALHQAFFDYENGGNIDAVKKAMIGLDADYMNVVFGLEEKIEGQEEPFNPFVEALQYYEDHGHEFARNNSRELRGGFRKKTQEHLLDYVVRKQSKLDLNKPFEDFDKDQKKKYQETKDKRKIEEYEWASNMAERMFRSTGRAVMFDYLVVNRDKPSERAVGLDYEPGPDERIDWASGGRDGCDYPMSKIYRFRENLKTSSEGGLMRPYIELFDGVDIYAGDFWTRTVTRINDIEVPDSEKKDAWLIKFRVAKKDLEKRKQEITSDLIKKNNYTPEKAKEELDKISFEILEDEPDWDKISDPKERAKQKEYYFANIYSDRYNPNNEGEYVKHINFRLMARKVEPVRNEETNKEEDKVVRGMEFKKMGDTPFSLWCSRMLGGPGEVLDKLTGDRAAFALNPNFDSLGKLIGAFDYSKSNAWKVKEQLLRNLIRFGRKKIKETGKQRWSEEAILAGVNKLTGLTDPNAPQFIQPQERTNILKDDFQIELSSKDRKKLEQQAKKEAEIEINKRGDITQEEKENILKKAESRIEGIMLGRKIENRINRNFAGSFLGWFLYGTIKEALKQALK